VFDYSNGQLTSEESVAPNGGYGFGPRHLDFHPTEPWVYVSLERQNRLDMFAFHDRTLLAAAVFQKGTLAEPGSIRGHQVAGTVHVHPNGRFVYVANRASSTSEFEGRRVFTGGENTLAVFAIDPATGEPDPIQHIDTRGIHCRTFHIDPSGRLLVAAHIMGLPVRDGATIRNVPACMSLFRIAGDGKLDFVRKYDIDVGERTMWWMGMVAL
jgi:6-phosphogluconolactonase (cycloisomerase 2 family)